MRSLRTRLPYPTRTQQRPVITPASVEPAPQNGPTRLPHTAPAAPTVNLTSWRLSIPPAGFLGECQKVGGYLAGYAMFLNVVTPGFVNSTHRASAASTVGPRDGRKGSWSEQHSMLCRELLGAGAAT